MAVPELKAFIYSPYNKMADVKMYLFFAEISTFALWTVIVLMLLSVVIKNFWCRYLCPYGALLGMVSWLSPLKITRNKERCIDCELCTKACPSSIKVHTATRVWSDECMSCLDCVAVCPVKDTLAMQASTEERGRPALGLCRSWWRVCLWGSQALQCSPGTGRTGSPRPEYQKRFQELNSPLYQHFRGEVPRYGPND